MLNFPLYDGFFPQLVLTVDELMQYRRLAKDRVSQLVRIAEDADCVYEWTDVKTKAGRPCQKAQMLALSPSDKATRSSTLLQASVHLLDTTAEEILHVLANAKTKESRKAMKYLYGDDMFVDARTLFTFPSPATRKKPSYSYRAIKWYALKANRRDGQDKFVDFCVLEFAGKKKLHPGSTVLGFCIQESISRQREVPSLEKYGITRACVSRTGILISKTHQSNILKVTSICQVDGDMSTLDRNILEELMQDQVCAVNRVKGLVERQRVGKLQYLEEWDWVSSADRRACAVCLRGFYFHRKHHCQTCGEVVCSSCAPLRELEEPLFDITHLRVCSVCMANAATTNDPQERFTMDYSETATSNYGTEAFVRGLRYPHHNPISSSEYAPTNLASTRRRRYSSHSGAIENISPYGGSVSKPRMSSSTRAEKKETLLRLMDQIRLIHEKLGTAISEVDYADSSNDGESDYGMDEIYEQIAQIKDSLDAAGVDFDDELEYADAPRDSYYDDHDDEMMSPVSSIYSEQQERELESVGSARRSYQRRENGKDDAGSSSSYRHSNQSDVHQVDMPIKSAEASKENAVSVEILPPPPPPLPLAYEPKSLEQPECDATSEKSVPILEKPRGILRMNMKIEALQRRLQNKSPDVNGNDSEAELEVRAAPVMVPAGMLPPKPPQPAQESPRTEHARITSEMVARLRGVMNSSELTKPPVRSKPPMAPRSVVSDVPQRPRNPPPTPPGAPEIPPFSKVRNRAISLPQPVSGATFFVDEDEAGDYHSSFSSNAQSLESVSSEDSSVHSSDDEVLSLDHADAFFAHQRMDAHDARSVLGMHARMRSVGRNQRLNMTTARAETEELRDLVESLVRTRSRCSSGQSSQEDFDV